MPRMNTLARKYFPFVLIPNFLYYDKFIAEMKRKLTLSFKQKAIVTNVVWSLGGKIVNMVSALFVGILVARYLGPENYGIMNYVISYVSIFTIVATFGMSNIEIRELSRNKEKKFDSWYLFYNSCMFFFNSLFRSSIIFICFSDR